MYVSSNLLLSFLFHHQNSARLSVLPSVCHTQSQTDASAFHSPNCTWQNIKVIMSTFCYFLHYVVACFFSGENIALCTFIEHPQFLFCTHTHT
jgi:hypothetical protein